MARRYKWFDWWKNLRPIPFVLFTAVLVILLDALIAYGFEMAGISDEEIGLDEIEQLSPLELTAGAIVLAPILETLLSQSLPFYLIRRFVRWRPEALAVVVSAIFFSLCHAVYSYWYALAILPSGILLALTFAVFRHRRESAYWMTVAVHGAMNLLVVIPMLYEKLK